MRQFLSENLLNTCAQKVWFIYHPLRYNNIYIQFIVDPILAITKTTINAYNKIWELS